MLPFAQHEWEKRKKKSERRTVCAFIRTQTANSQSEYKSHFVLSISRTEFLLFFSCVVFLDDTDEHIQTGSHRHRLLLCRSSNIEPTGKSKTWAKQVNFIRSFLLLCHNHYYHHEFARDCNFIRERDPQPLARSSLSLWRGKLHGNIFAVGAHRKTDFRRRRRRRWERRRSRSSRRVLAMHMRTHSVGFCVEAIKNWLKWCRKLQARPFFFDSVYIVGVQHIHKSSLFHIRLTATQTHWCERICRSLFFFCTEKPTKNFITPRQGKPKTLCFVLGQNGVSRNNGRFWVFTVHAVNRTVEIIIIIMRTPT